MIGLRHYQNKYIDIDKDIDIFSGWKIFEQTVIIRSNVCLIWFFLLKNPAVFEIKSCIGRAFVMRLVPTPNNIAPPFIAVFSNTSQQKIIPISFCLILSLQARGREKIKL